jgi:hypothetical protein
METLERITQDWGMWDTMTSDGTRWTLVMIVSMARTHFLVTCSGQVHFRGVVETWTFGEEEMWRLIEMIASFYRQLDEEVLVEAGRWIKKCCKEIIPME